MTNDDAVREHLSPDDFDAWLDGVLPPARARHLDSCPACFKEARSHREVALLLSSLPSFEPAPHFENRVLAKVTALHPEPAWAAAAAAPVRRRATLSRPVMAGLAVALLVSVAGSVAWSLANQPLLAALGARLTTLLSAWGWTGLQSLTATMTQQPWWAPVRDAAGSPLAWAGMAVAYVAGILALRRLMATPDQAVARA